MRARGDLAGNAKTVDVILNGQNVGTLFEVFGSTCAPIFDQDQMFIPQEVFNGLLTGGDAEITLQPSNDAEWHL